jgi:hypothetical protein
MQGAKAMATTDTLGLFATPEQYQAQQLAQQQANEQQRAFNFAQLSPRDQAVYGMFLGGQQLGRGLGGLLGAQDPQLRMISQRQQLMQSINPADPKSLMTGIQRAAQSGDQELAMKLTDFMNKQGGLVKPSGGIQEAARINAITEELATLDPDNPDQKPKYDALVAERTRLERAKRAASGDKLSQLQDLYDKRKEAVASFGAGSEDVKIIDRLINSIASEKGDKSFESIVKSERIGVLTDELETLVAENKKDTPEYRRKFAELKSLQGDKAGAPIKEVVLAEEIAKLDAFIRNAEDPTAPAVIDAKTKAQLYRDAMKRERPNLNTLGLAKGGKYDNQPVFLDETSRKTFVFDTDKEGKQIEIPYTGGLKGLRGGTEVNVGGPEIKVDTGETGKAAGRELGKELITVKDKQSAIDSIQDALSILNQGIYAGSYSDIRKGLAKYAGIGDPAKVARTEEFVSYIGDVVVSRLKDFGGNDSEQELKYLNRIIGGDLEIEPAALKRILERADAKIRRGIERLREQAESGERKESLTTTLPPAKAEPPPLKPTRRFNKSTGKLETVK